MENNEKKTQPLDVKDGAPDILSRAKANSKLIMGLAIFVLVVLIAVFAWFFISQKNAAKADEALGRADAAANDSVALVLYKEAATMGHKSGNIAKVQVAIRLYAQKDYEGAISYLEDASIDDKVVAAGAKTLLGDCYVNLQKYPEALKAFDNAEDLADGNPRVVPVILIKKANIYRAQKNYAAEAEAYKEIIDEYPSFIQTSRGFDVRKYYERAKAAAESK